MKKTIQIFAMLLLCLSCSDDDKLTSYEDKELSISYTNRLNVAFDSVCNAMQIKGASCAVLIPGKGIWERTNGFSHESQEINNNMSFTIGSNTKTYIAALMLKLQENGVLNINDKASKWLSDIPYLDENITIKQLLNHTSGLGDFSYNPDFIQAIKDDFSRIWEPEEALPYFEAPYFSPGETYQYSDQNYVVAGLIIEAATQKSLKESMRALILNPSGLNDTYYYPFEGLNLNFPHSWSADFTDGAFVDLDALGYTRIAFCSADNAAGGMASTAKDNAIFWDRLMSGKIINQSSLQLMLQFVAIGPANNYYGLGIQKTDHLYEDRTFLAHNGYVPGSINDNAYDMQSGAVITVLTNQDLYQDLSSIIGTLHKVTVEFE